MITPYRCTLLGKMKSGKNHVQITRAGRRYPKKAFTVWREEMLRQMPIPAQPFVGPVWMQVHYVPGDLLRRDLPGISDALLHVLEKKGVLLDDAQVKNLTWVTYAVNRTRPLCRIELRPMVNIGEQEEA